MPFNSPFTSVTIPDVGLASYVLDDLSPQDEGRRAVVDYDSGDVLTYGQLTQAVDAFADAVAGELCPGEVVALIGPNSARWVVAYLGCLRAGIVVTPLNTLATVDEIAKQITGSAAALVYCDASTATVARSGAEISGLANNSVRELSGVSLYPDESIHAPVRLVSDPGSHLAVVPYSSGTTGVPKGVMLSHRNLVANLCQLDDSLDVTTDSVVVGLLPFSHIYGMSVVLNLSLRRRATIVTMRSFSLESLLAVIQTERATHLPVAPPVMVALAKAPSVSDFDISSVQVVLSGAAPLDAVLAKTVEDRLGCAVRQAYGMTEMSPVSHIAPLSVAAIPAESVGLTVANMTCKLVDPANGVEYDIPSSGVSLPGELWCKGPNIMLGYLNNSAATADTLDSNGYLHTGDIAVVDSAGAITIVDRLKELIKYKGYQVAPAELEGILLTHEMIVDAAVVGQPLGNGDEAPHAFVVRAVGSGLSESAVVAHVEERVAPYKKVRRVTFVDTIPKSASGKILRRSLRQPS
ncbi:4-coumarate--CoA ligase family protein [Rhodococcus sp. KBS0724]|uniref:AMP-binding protein n=1 Tax=Rhodococcus sp. KBS0724 TaxID=1179674 RepID=UPI00110DE45A|nr:AMP-binding protein [Rhodococcus sp. KBS0724]TSD50028.1 4-coumarate--CoA ligase family protein [Rhodococcus sp. KBS0724]